MESEATEDATQPEAPRVYFATEPYVEQRMAQTRNELTEAIYQMGERINEGIHAQTRWMVGLLIGLAVALVLAVLINPLLHGG
jgi:hypothetical protein